VVADEVRKLSRATDEAVGQISSGIQAVADSIEASSRRSCPRTTPRTSAKPWKALPPSSTISAAATRKSPSTAPA
jgi:hypothetical protein